MPDDSDRKEMAPPHRVLPVEQGLNGEHSDISYKSRQWYRMLLEPTQHTILTSKVKCVCVRRLGFKRVRGKAVEESLMVRTLTRSLDLS